MTIDHRVQEPVPILPRHVRDEPRVLLSVEPDLLGEPTLDQEIGCVSEPQTSVTDIDGSLAKALTIDEITVELKTGIIEDKVNSSSALILE